MIKSQMKPGREQTNPIIIRAMPIHVLADEIASQIAAGEVIERPASVIKELVENAINSGAKHIEIRIQGSGQTLIEIQDDGAGIPATELELAVTRHATSKLVNTEDLFNIQTLGFRGEALASIASVSRLSIHSAIEGSDSGAILHVEGGHVLEQKISARIKGTTIRVEDLFYNVPARRKFLKKDSTEKQNNDAFLARYALAYPGIQFKVWQDDLPGLTTSGSDNSREILASVYGLEYARELLQVDYRDQNIRVDGFISPTSITKSNRREITFFVNGRWVQDTSLSAALIQAYHTYLMVGRYPVSVLFIQLPPEDVDVNVHPAKSEVRFKSPDQLFSVVQRAVRKALLLTNPVPALVSSSTWMNPMSEQTHFFPQPFENPDYDTPASLPYTQFAAPEVPESSIEPLARPAGLMPLLRLVGQVGATYIIAEGPDGLYLIDQHAAHERILYERYIQQRGKTTQSQILLEPVLVDLPPNKARLLHDQMDAIARMGFDLEPFGSGSFMVRSLPAMFSKISAQTALQIFVDDFEEDEAPFQQEIEAKLVARICKRVAVKGGQVLSTEEQKQLLEDLENCTSPRTCPHGRPTMIHLSVDLLERQFGRRGAR